jgi:hypothetical protein
MYITLLNLWACMEIEEFRDCWISKIIMKLLISLRDLKFILTPKSHIYLD